MTKATKTFKIGEYVIGGIIKVNLAKDILIVQFVDYYSKDVIYEEKVNVNADNAHRTIRNFLEVNGTPYYADKVMKWIETKTTLNNGNHFKW